MMVSKLPLCKIALYLFSIFLVGCGSSASDVASITKEQVSESSLATNTDESLKSTEDSTDNVTVSDPSNLDSEESFVSVPVTESSKEDESNSSGFESGSDDESSAEVESSNVDINITWSDNSDNEDEFIVERRIASNVDYGTTYYLAENVTSYNDVDVQTGETYCYRISASNTVGQSSSSETCIEL